MIPYPCCLIIFCSIAYSAIASSVRHWVWDKDLRRHQSSYNIHSEHGPVRAGGTRFGNHQIRPFRERLCKLSPHHDKNRKYDIVGIVAKQVVARKQRLLDGKLETLVMLWSNIGQIGHPQQLRRQACSNGEGDKEKAVMRCIGSFWLSFLGK